MFFPRQEAAPSKTFTLLPQTFGSYLFLSFWVSVAVALTALAQAKIELDGILHSILEIFSSYTKLSGVFGNPLLIGLICCFISFTTYILSPARISKLAPAPQRPQSRPFTAGEPAIRDRLRSYRR